MQPKTILNRAQKFKSFVYGPARWVNEAGQPAVEVEWHGQRPQPSDLLGLRSAQAGIRQAGAEKFFNIKCRKANLKPDAVVLVATIKALKMHGGVAKDQLGKENVAALEAGCKNLGRHMRNLARFGVPVLVGINRFTTDTDAEARILKAYCREFGVKALDCTHWADGGAGAEDLAREVAALCDAGGAEFRTLYPDSLRVNAAGDIEGLF